MAKTNKPEKVEKKILITKFEGSSQIIQNKDKMLQEKQSRTANPKLKCKRNRGLTEYVNLSDFDWNRGKHPDQWFVKLFHCLFCFYCCWLIINHNN